MDGKARELGTRALKEGSTVTVRVLGGVGASRPALRVSVTSLEVPYYARYGRWRRGDTNVRVSGLGPGRFRVYSELGVDQVVDLDGTEGVHLTLDLRR